MPRWAPLGQALGPGPPGEVPLVDEGVIVAQGGMETEEGKGRLDQRRESVCELGRASGSGSPGGSPVVVDGMVDGMVGGMVVTEDKTGKKSETVG